MLRRSNISHSGAGVLIIDSNSSSLLLIFDYTKDFNCCGGRVDHQNKSHDYLEQTAAKELREETRTLIHCHISDLKNCPFVDIPVPSMREDIRFRCYIMRIPCPADICDQFEHFDMRRLPDYGDYRETTRLEMFPLKQFTNLASLEKIIDSSKATDRFGNARSLNRRVISVLCAALDKDLL